MATLGSIAGMSSVTGTFNVAPGLAARCAAILFWLAIFSPTIAFALAGAIAHGLSAACNALRDIAQSSWR